jgi:hypothetical protein
MMMTSLEFWTRGTKKETGGKPRVGITFMIRLLIMMCMIMKSKVRHRGRGSLDSYAVFFTLALWGIFFNYFFK